VAQLPGPTEQGKWQRFKPTSHNILSLDLNLNFTNMIVR
jgi:hypothetical protein